MSTVTLALRMSSKLLQIAKQKTSKTTFSKLRLNRLTHLEQSIGLLLGIYTKIVSLCSVSLGTKLADSMCRYYGHKVNKNWQGDFPKCIDCHIKVKDPRELRKASLNFV